MQQSFPQCPLICLPLFDRVADELEHDELSIFFKFLSAKGCVSFGDLMMGHIDQGWLLSDVSFH